MPYVPEKGHRLERTLANGRKVLRAKYYDDVPDDVKEKRQFVKGTGLGRDFWWPAFQWMMTKGAIESWLADDPHPAPHGPVPTAKQAEAFGPEPKLTEFSRVDWHSIALRDWEQKLEDGKALGRIEGTAIDPSMGTPYLVTFDGRRQVAFPDHKYNGVGSNGLCVPRVRFFEVNERMVHDAPWSVHSGFHIELLNWNILPEERFAVLNPAFYEAIEKFQAVEGTVPQNTSDIVGHVLMTGKVPPELV